MAGLELYVRRSDRWRLAEIDDFRTLSVTKKHAGIPTWSLTMSANAPTARLWQPERGIIVERNGEPFLSGPYRKFSRSKTDDDDVVTVEGFGDLIFLKERYAQPSPYPYTSAAYDVFSGPAESAIKHYVDVNAGSLATGDRRISGLTTATDLHRGNTTTSQARFDLMLDLVNAIALPGGDLGYKIEQGSGQFGDTTERTLLFDVVVPRDLTQIAKFGIEYGNLASFEYEFNAPSANAAIVAGSGQGTARSFIEGQLADSIALWGRIEGPLLDRRDTSVEDQMVQTLNEELEKGSQQNTLSIKVSNTERLVYGRDWDVGDKVSVSIDGGTVSDVVREVTIKWSNDGPEDVSAVIGTPESTSAQVPALFAAFRRLRGDVYALQRRF